MEIIGTQLPFLEFTENQLQILRCYLLPNQMVHRPEAPLPQDANAPILELGHDGPPQRILDEISTDQMKDPIYELFNAPEASKDGEHLCTVYFLAFCTSYRIDDLCDCIHVPYFIFSPVIDLHHCSPACPLCRCFRHPAQARSGQPYCCDLQSTTQINSFVVLSL